MSVILDAPHNIPQTRTILPNPELGDTQDLRDEVIYKESIDGTIYSHIKTNNRKRLIYDFDITRLKALEILEFFTAYNDEYIRLTNHDNEVWKVKLLNSTLDFLVATMSQDGNITLEFEGEKIA